MFKIYWCIRDDFKSMEEKKLSDFALLTENASNIVSRIFQMNTF